MGISRVKQKKGKKKFKKKLRACPKHWSIKWSYSSYFQIGLAAENFAKHTNFKLRSEKLKSSKNKRKTVEV